MTISRLLDLHGRPSVDNLRVSLTPVCDLRCTFCHQEGTVAHGRSMTTQEVIRICETAARVGVRYLKFTGGEPLLRSDIVEIVRATSPWFEDVSLVTNGRRLDALAQPLKDAGLKRLNVSLHTRDATTYKCLTGDSIEPALRGIAAAVRVGFEPVKVNVVVTHRNVHEIEELIRWSARERVQLQLIEVHAPPGSPDHILDQRVPLDIIQARLRSAASRVEKSRMHDRARYVLDGTTVEVTRPQENPAFCAACRRLRLTHDGYLKPCLMRADNHVDVIGPLRGGAGDEGLTNIFREAASRREPYCVGPTKLPVHLLAQPDRRAIPLGVAEGA
ncbi:MAG: GTP 3',8-cyclase MoaA [Candidatus Thermoplasmatota archaeon]